MPSLRHRKLFIVIRPKTIMIIQAVNRPKYEPTAGRARTPAPIVALIRVNAEPRTPPSDTGRKLRANQLRCLILFRLSMNDRRGLTSSGSSSISVASWSSKSSN
jgi:hypothetical protein